MQLTRFDRWLRETFVHEIRVYSLRPPQVLPSGIKATNLPDAPGRKYRHQYTACSSKAADALIAEFKNHNQMFTTRVVDRSAWYVPLIAPEGKSISWWCLWLVIAAVGLFFTATALHSLWINPTFRKNLDEAIEIFQG